MKRATLTDMLTGRKWDLAALLEETDEINLLIGRAGSGCAIELGILSNETKECKTQEQEKQQVQMVRDIVDKALSVSRKHARIRYDNGFRGRGYYIIDTGSTNGTFIGEELEPIRDWAYLSDGDKLHFGKYPVVFEEQGEGI